jgi:hypothetical protein
VFKRTVPVEGAKLQILLFLRVQREEAVPVEAVGDLVLQDLVDALCRKSCQG